MGITKDQSSPWQKLAAVPAEEFEPVALTGDATNLTIWWQLCHHRGDDPQHEAHQLDISMSDDDFEVVFGSGNVFRDFSYADADIRQAKCILAAEIIKILNAREWSTRRAEEATGVNHADFSRIRNANIGRFTLDRLMAILGKLGQEVELAVSVKPRQQQRSAADARLGQGSEQVETAIVWSVIAIVVIAVVVTSRFWWPKRWTEEWEEQQAARERYRLANGWVGKCYHEIMRDGGERSCPYCGKQFPEREPRHPRCAIPPSRMPSGWPSSLRLY